MSLALDWAGYTDLAQRHALFYAGQVRRTARRGKPLGSLPAASYANGEEGLPHLVLDAEAVGATLGLFWEHAAALDPADRVAFLETVWEAVELATDFLAAWADGQTHEPLHTFSPAALRDTQSIEMLLTTYAGIESAIEMAEILDKGIRREWEERRAELDVLVRIRCLDEEGHWKVEDTLPFGALSFLDVADPQIDALASRLLETANGKGCAASAHTFARLAMLWRGRPQKLELLRTASLTSILDTPGYSRDAGFAFPDGLTAAYYLIATLAAFEGE